MPRKIPIYFKGNCIGQIYSDDTIERFIIRDTDSRLNIREAMAVQEWITSKEPFHIMREPPHQRQIMGGMWGAIGGMFPNMMDIAKLWAESQPDRTRDLDEAFLCRQVWPHIEHHHMSHDDYLRYNTHLSKKFPIDLEPEMFVGQIIEV